MDEEYIYEVIEHLESLTRITTFLLYKYKQLTSIIIRGNQNGINSIIAEIIQLKDEESTELEYFAKDSERASEALDYLEDNYEEKKNKMNYDASLCYTRIHEKLARIELIEGLKEDYNANKKDVLNTRSCASLIRFGYQEEEAVDLYIKTHQLLDSALSLRYASILESDNNPDAIRMRIEEAFASPNDLEDILIKHHFGRLPKTLDKDLIPDFNINPAALKKFIKIELDDNILDLVNKINAVKTDYELKQCIALFKSYLIFLEKGEIKRITGLVYALIADKTIAELLTDIINEAKKIQEQENSDLNAKQFS